MAKPSAPKKNPTRRAPADYWLSARGATASSLPGNTPDTFAEPRHMGIARRTRQQHSEQCKKGPRVSQLSQTDIS